MAAHCESFFSLSSNSLCAVMASEYHPLLFNEKAQLTCKGAVNSVSWVREPMVLNAQWSPCGIQLPSETVNSCTFCFNVSKLTKKGCIFNCQRFDSKAAIIRPLLPKRWQLNNFIGIRSGIFLFFCFQDSMVCIYICVHFPFLGLF